LRRTEIYDTEATGTYGRLRILESGARPWTDGLAKREDVAATWMGARAA